MAEFSPKFKEALSLVQKPGRYTGGEPGSVYKDKDKVDVRMAFCFPDTYEIGMSFLGEKILYDILNRHENWWCERAFGFRHHRLLVGIRTLLYQHPGHAAPVRHPAARCRP